jgi:hypothetical protein
MRRKNNKVTVTPFHEAVGIALNKQTSKLLGYAKIETVDKFAYRVKSFLTHEFNPMLGLVGSVNAYLNRLKLSGRSASYIRCVKSVLTRFVASLPTCQLSMFSGVTK